MSSASTAVQSYSMWAEMSIFSVSVLLSFTTSNSLRSYEARFWMFNRLHWLQKLHAQTLKIMLIVNEKLSVHSCTDVSL